MRLAAVFVLVLAGWIHAQPAASVDWPEVAVHGEKPAGLSLTLSLSKDHFYKGEVIPATFTFTNTSQTPFHLWIGNYDRSGRATDIRLAARDVAGKPVTDPLAWYFQRGGFGGGLGNFEDLGTWSITLPANQWLRFDQPGTYTIVAWSNRVQKGAKADRFGSHASDSIELVSNPVQVTIDPLTPEMAQQIVEDCRAKIDAAKKLRVDASTPPAMREEIAARERAASDCFTTLRYLDTRDARAELRQLLSWPNSFEAFAGILAAPDPSAEAGLLLDDVKAGRVTLNAQTVEMYCTLKTHADMQIPRQPSPAEIAALQQKYIADSKAARAEILDAGKSAVTKTGGVNLDLIWTTFQTDMQNSAARAEVVRHQLEFSPEQQKQLLYLAQDSNVTGAGGADFLPLVRQAAAAPNYNREALVALAKLHPEEAKALIVHDVASGELHYRRNEQGFRDESKAILALPPGPIPELQEPLRKMLAGDGDLDAAFDLVDRYGSPALLPDMLAAYQPKAGRWDCEIQGAALRFWIRCDEKAGLAALQEAMQNRATTGCYRNALQEVLSQQWTPAAQPFVLASLKDPSQDVVRSAILVLEQHGDPGCADVLASAAAAFPMHFLAQQLLQDKRWTWTPAQRDELTKVVGNP